MEILIEVFGWVGAVMLLLAYYLSSRGIYPATSKESLIINMVGGLGLMINGAYHNALPSVGLNLVWTIVGVTALIKLLNKQRQ